MAGTTRENKQKTAEDGRQKTESGKQKNKYERPSSVVGSGAADLTGRMMPESLAAEAAVLGFDGYRPRLHRAGC